MASVVGLLGAHALGLLAAASAKAQAIEHPRSPVPPLPPAAALTLAQRLPAHLTLRAVTIDGVTPQLDFGLSSFIGQPLTPDLVRRVEQTLNRRLGREHRAVTAALVSFDASGTLDFTLKRFTIGHVKTTGGTARDQAYAEHRLGLTPGARLDRPALNLALDSLNRYPFRQAAVTVTPTTANSAEADVTLTPAPPWSFTAADKYAGGPHESWRRLTATATAGGVLGADSVTALQFTAAPDFFTRAHPHPAMADLNLTYTKPTGTRGTFEASFDVGGQTFHFAPDVYWVAEVDGTFGYRYLLTAASNGHGESDIRAGVDFRHERVFHSLDSHSGGPVLSNTAAAFDELFAGYHRDDASATVQSDFDIAFRLSTGGFEPGNRNGHVADYSGGRMTSARYAYTWLTWEHTAALGKTWQWHSQVIGMAATGPTPYWDQMILGGHDYVRGYFMPDFSCDDGLIWRNEVTLKTDKGPAPFIMADVGSGRDIASRMNRTLASFGAGVVVPLNKHATVTIDAARALRAGSITRAGATSIEGVLAFRF